MQKIKVAILILIIGAGIAGAAEQRHRIGAGLDLELLPSLHLDINANYRFIDWQNIKELDKHINTDTITLGAAVRLRSVSGRWKAKTGRERGFGSA